MTMNEEGRNRTALVTGGTRGIGRGICELLKERGYHVIAGYGGNVEKAKAFTSETGIPAYQWDVSDFDACQEAVAKIAAENGTISVLVNNAGITRDGTLKRMTYENWMAVIQTNLTSVFALSKAVWEPMLAQKFGRIVNISSINGQAGQYGQVNYCAAKAGVIGLTRQMAVDYGPDNIRVNAVCPGTVPTPLVRQTYAEGGGFASMIQDRQGFDDIMDKAKARFPIGRVGAVEDIASAALYLASDEASWTTGIAMPVDGGMSAW